MPNPVLIPSCHPSLPLVRSRKPSRTQLRHASAVRRLFSETTDSESPPDEYHMALKISEDTKPHTGGESSAQAVVKDKSNEVKATKEKITNNKDFLPKPSPTPYLRAGLASLGIDIMADSANMES